MAGSWIHETDDYEIETELYSGPLDLLLDLIQKSELDITKIALAQVTDQFLVYVRENENADPGYISEFMVIASKLVQIKSEAMLPRSPVRQPEEEDLGESLARQLRIYREIKNTTAWLNDRLDQNLRCHLQVPKSYPVNVQLDLTGIDLTDLIVALERLASQESPLLEGSSIRIPKMTLKKKVQEIVGILKNSGTVSFQGLIGEDSDRIQIIVVFLAILELVKQDMIDTEQPDLFGDISLTPGEKLFATPDEELAIGEDL
ncbi:MAG TPA: segregation/condensation protein A [Anaerolineaceae bacterium]|nr:segregation/condensation protein A [Anaerolineaceae bacterium]